MQEQIVVTGMILKADPAGEYDRRVVLLTRERGKLTAFARGARRQGSRLLAATNPFCFGQFKLYEGRTAYSLAEASIQNYFEGLREDYEAACYGMYFLEVIDYYTRENNEEKEMLRLLYQSLRALQVKSLPHLLVQYIFEIKALVLNGEYPGPPARQEAYLDSTLYTLSYIAESSIEKLYTFTVTEPVLKELADAAAFYRQRFVDRKLNGLRILDEMIKSC